MLMEQFPKKGEWGGIENTEEGTGALREGNEVGCGLTPCGGGPALGSCSTVAERKQHVSTDAGGRVGVLLSLRKFSS